MWLEYLRYEVWTRARILNLHLFGHVSFNKNEHEFITKELKEHLKTINAHIKGKSFMVGSHLTIVDIWCAIVLQEQMQATLDTNFRNSMAPLVTYFKSICALPEFKARLGNVKPGKKTMAPKFEGEQKKEENKDKAAKK